MSFQPDQRPSPSAAMERFTCIIKEHEKKNQPADDCDDSKLGESSKTGGEGPILEEVDSEDNDDSEDEDNSELKMFMEPARDDPVDFVGIVGGEEEDVERLQERREEMLRGRAVAVEMLDSDSS